MFISTCFALGFVRPADPLRVRGNLLLDFKNGD
jgi:hypothetical protein